MIIAEFSTEKAVSIRLAFDSFSTGSDLGGGGWGALFASCFISLELPRNVNQGIEKVWILQSGPLHRR